MSVNSKMTAIANATRALDGSTAALTLDGIASKLGVEKTNINAALAALVEKEVDVPVGSTSAALASLIASIEAGGGATIKTGSITPASEGSSITITHGAGAVPKLFVVFTTNTLGQDKAALAMYSSSSNIKLSNYTPALLSNRYNSSSGLRTDALPIANVPSAVTVNSQSITLNISRNSSVFATREYQWFAITWEE